MDLPCAGGESLIVGAARDRVNQRRAPVRSRSEARLRNVSSAISVNLKTLSSAGSNLAGQILFVRKDLKETPRVSVLAGRRNSSVPSHPRGHGHRYFLRSRLGLFLQEFLQDLYRSADSQESFPQHQLLTLRLL